LKTFYENLTFFGSLFEVILLKYCRRIGIALRPIPFNKFKRFCFKENNKQKFVVFRPFLFDKYFIKNGISFEILISQFQLFCPRNLHHLELKYKIPPSKLAPNYIKHLQDQNIILGEIMFIILSKKKQNQIFTVALNNFIIIMNTIDNSL
jgi:hypothetical protein